MTFDWRAWLGRRRPVGVVDTRGGRVRGWAYDASAPSPLTIEFTVDGEGAGSTTADRYRADLKPECPDGRCAFEFDLPARFLDGKQHAVEARVRGSRFTEVLRPADHFLALQRHTLRFGAWAISGEVAGDTMQVEGWCIAPPGIDGGIVRANDRTVDAVFTPDRRDWKSPLPADTLPYAFRGSLPLDRSRSDVHFSFGLEQPFSRWQDLHYPLFDVPLPDREQRKRVDGHGIEAIFNIGGYSNAKKLDAVARHFAGRGLAEIGPVLDWGCGCGRVARFLVREGVDLHGADIDADNVAWCREHVGTNFVAISPDPPTPFADDFFGAIYGLSVFTHLTRDYEQAWLAELRRITRPGGIIMMSVHGGLIAARSGMMEHIASSGFADGFADIGRNSDIDAVTKGSTYYRNVFHQSDYIAKVWGRYFEILSIEEGVIDNLQDLVVGRKRGP